MTPLSDEQIAFVQGALPGVILHEAMSKHTNFRLGGPAALYVVASSSDGLLTAVQTALQAGIPFYVFGGGSNILVSDDGYEGLMIQAANREMSIHENRVKCESGVITAFVARKSAEAGLSGFEWAVGVPGTIGGAVYGNAGCFGGEIKDVVATVDAYRLSDGSRMEYPNAACAFGYRDSLFKHEPHVILGCTLTLQPGDTDAAMRTLNEINARRKAKQPLAEASAGCMFKNFDFRDESELKALRRNSDIPRGMIEAKRLSAGWLVDQAGLLGKTMGNIKVSDKHGNFIINTGGGRAQDVIAMTSLVKMKIRDEFGIMLEDEVQLVGFGE